MESQSVPRPHAIPLNQVNKTARIPKPKFKSPPTSPTNPTGPGVENSPQVNQLTQNRGWTSFDDSPVHAATGNNFSGNSPWSSGPGNEKWAAFTEQKNKDPASNDAAPATQPRKRTSDQTYPLNSQTPGVTQTFPRTTPLKTPGNFTRTGETPTQSRQRNPSKEDVIGQSQPPGGANDVSDPWCITSEQREYYMKQFATMQSDIKGKIDGQTARNFFTKSKLPILELSHIWELSDMDQDGHLTLDEFCTAFHLVVARKNGYELPIHLPQALVPTLIDIGGGEVPAKSDPFQNDADVTSRLVEHTGAPTDVKTSEQWETFSERTNSSTNLANFDQSQISIEENLPHPVAVRMTPSRHPELWKVVGDARKSPIDPLPSGETLDEESTTSSPQIRSKHGVTTNPYGFLQNELSDSGCEGRETSEKKLSAQNSTDSKDSRNSGFDEKPFRKTKGRTASTSSVASSSSSVATSDRSSNDVTHDRSDIEHSDWSLRPLRPRSGSSSSMESSSSSVPPSTASPQIAAPAPTPPPRPPLHSSPKPGSSKSNSLDKNEAKIGLKDPESRLDGPTPPPRPHPATSQETPQTQELFADFSNFNKPHESAEGETPPEKVVRPIPAPRPTKELLKVETDESELKENENDKSFQNKKAPTKPPRTRIMSTDVCKPEITNPISISNEPKTLLPAPKQDPTRNKSNLQSSIRELKLRNTQLARTNADLQQQLKDVMESRISVEMNIHQMRPFTQ